MAILIHGATGHRVALLPQHVFGRGPTASSVLEDMEASRLHAVLRWAGHRWELRDYSRNGTLVDGHRVPRDVAIVLSTGQSVMFGADPSSAWQVQDIEPPGPMLLPEDGGSPLRLGPSNHFPEGSFTTSIVQNEHGDWWCLCESDERALKDGALVTLMGRVWRFESCSDSQVTEGAGDGSPILPASPPCSAHFQVSLDEEHVILRIRIGDREWDLGERTHHYLLLTLARLRMEAAERGLDEAEQGWVMQARLAKMLGMDPGHLNIQIFRLRQQLIQALGREMNPPELIARRRGELRMGDLAVHVRRGSHASASFVPNAFPNQALPRASAERAYRV